jgi:hypothetical protein
LEEEVTDWRELIEAQERSGVSVKQFCEEQGSQNSPSTFGGNGFENKLPCGRTIRLWLWLRGDERSVWPICARSPI